MHQILIAVPTDKIEAIEAAPDISTLVDRTAGLPSLSLGALWAVLHNMISGELPVLRDSALDLGVSFDDNGKEAILLGGRSLRPDAAFGKVRLHTPEFVITAATKLAGSTAEDLRSAWDPDFFNNNNLAPYLVTSDQNEIDAAIETYMNLSRFFADTSERGDAIVTYVDRT